MSSVTSEFAAPGGGSGVEFDEIELTLGLPGEPRERKSGRKRQFPDVDVKESDCECSKPPSKGQVVGWPPVKCYRKFTKKINCKYVKVAVDGVPYLRKVDLKSYTGYQQLLCVFEDMFSCFDIRNVLNENKMIDSVNRSDHIPTYEDKDGDWMLLGDVPWRMFVKTCTRIRLRKSSAAINQLGSSEFNIHWFLCITFREKPDPHTKREEMSEAPKIQQMSHHHQVQQQKDERGYLYAFFFTMFCCCCCPKMCHGCLDGNCCCCK